MTLFPAIAGDSLFAGQYPYADSSDVKIKQPAETYFDSFRNKEEFIYITDVRQVKNSSFLFRIGRFLSKFFETLGTLLKALPVLIKIALWGLVIFLIVVIFTKTGLNRVFYSNKSIGNTDYEIKDLEEQITDFDSAIQNEVSNKQYRRAIRLLFLKLINVLDRVEFIKYSKEKTNIDYLREIRDSQFRPGFLSLIGIYNNVWYGQFEIDQQQYQKYEKDFIQFHNQINAQE